MDDREKQMLDLFLQPAFYAKDGAVIWCNHTAAAMIPLGTPLFRLLEQEDTLFFLWNREGTLSISLILDGEEYDASVQASGEYDLFVAARKNADQRYGALAIVNAAASMRRPLQAMVNAAETLFESLPEQERSAAAEELNRSIYRFVRLCGQMADGGELLLHRKVIHREPTDLRDFFIAFVEQVRPLVESLGVDLEYTPLPAPVRGDMDISLLERALYNLLANALSYTPKGGAIAIGTEQQDRTLLVTVSDNGEGIAREVAPTIFERFWERNIGDSRWGLGLGLPMVREIARLHGGSVMVSTNDGGRGTRVTLSLSLKKTSLSLHAPKLRYDSYGPFHHGLVELSDVLDAELYHPQKFQ